MALCLQLVIEPYLGNYSDKKKRRAARIQLSWRLFFKRPKQCSSHPGETDTFQENVINKALTCRQLHLQFFMLASSDDVPPITIVADRNDGRGANVLAPKKGE